MRDREGRIVSEFKSAYIASIYFPDRMARYQERLDQMQGIMEVHSPALDGQHNVPIDHDVRLADYITLRSRLEDSIRIMSLEIRRLDDIINCMTPEIKKYFTRIYSNKCNYAAAAWEYGTSERNMHRIIDHEILKAVEKYENTDT